MRQRLIGQTVTFKLEYAFNGREFACVVFQGENVAKELLRQGLAKLRESKAPPQAHDLEGEFRRPAVFASLKFLCKASASKMRALRAGRMRGGGQGSAERPLGVGARR